MFPPGIEPGTFRVLGGCDNHYTTETEVSGADRLAKETLSGPEMPRLAYKRQFGEFVSHSSLR